MTNLLPYTKRATKSGDMTHVDKMSTHVDKMSTSAARHNKSRKMNSGAQVNLAMSVRSITLVNLASHNLLNRP